MRTLEAGRSVLGQDGLDRDDVEGVIDEEKWLRNWSASMCELSGLEPGTRAFEECQRSMQERVVAGAPEEIVAEPGCFACRGRTPLLARARRFGQRLANE